jgi:hypothetical protein
MRSKVFVAFEESCKKSAFERNQPVQRVSFSRLPATDGSLYPYSNETIRARRGVIVGIIGHTEGLYNSVLEGFPNAPRGAGKFGTFLKPFNIAGGFYQLQEQNSKGQVSPFTVGNTTVSVVDFIADIAARAGAANWVKILARRAGIAGIGIQTTEIWWKLYKSMEDLNNAPLHYDQNGEPVYEDPNHIDGIPYWELMRD